MHEHFDHVTRFDLPVRDQPWLVARSLYRGRVDGLELRQGLNTVERALGLVKPRGLLRGDAECLGDFLHVGTPAELFLEMPHRALVMGHLAGQVHRGPDRVRLLLDRAAHGLADPVDRVRGKAALAAQVELLDRAHEAHVAFADEVAEGEAPAQVCLGDLDHEALVGLGNALAGTLVACLEALEQLDLLLLRQQWDIGDGLEVFTQRVRTAHDSGPFRVSSPDGSCYQNQGPCMPPTSFLPVSAGPSGFPVWGQRISQGERLHSVDRQRPRASAPGPHTSLCN